MIEHYNYMLKHWQEYNLTDTKEDFIALLNILEAHGETIDSLHNAVFNGHNFFGEYEEFCIYDATCDRDVVEHLFSCNRFIDNIEDLKEFLYEQKQDFIDDGWDNPEETFKEYYCDDKWIDDRIIRTRDGYVHSILV